MNRRWIRSAVLCTAASLSACTAWCFTKDTTNKIVTVSPQGSPALTVADLRAAANFLSTAASPSNVWTWRFQRGDYVINASIMLTNGGALKGVRMVSDDPAGPARIIRDPVWDTAQSPQQMMLLRFCRNIALSGFEFYGKTVDFPKTADFPAQPDWSDQGVEFSSCDTVSVTGNKFFNIGNSALRVATDHADPVQGVNSFHTTVTNNVFDNIYQIATTAIDKLHGGTAHYRLANNVFRRLRGSIKFATRTPGAYDVAIVNNVVESSSHYGLEIVNYQQMEIRGNVLQNIAENAITMYTDGNGDAMVKGFPWGDNFTVAGNVIRNAGGAVRYSHKPFWDGQQNVPKNLVIADNAIDGTQGIDPAVIYVGGNTVAGLNVSNNRFFATAGQSVMLPSGSTGVVQSGNVALAARPVHDLDGNLKSQVAWQQPSTSQLMQWPAPSVWSPAPLVIPSGWTIVAMADLDGDHRTDAILSNALTGQVAVLPTGKPAAAQPLAKLDATWQLAAVGDLDGNGKADLVWRHSGDTATIVWFMDQDAAGNTGIASRATFQMDASWQLIAAADFDGDGKADLLWRQPNTANTAIWLMAGATIKGKPALPLDASSYMVATGDFDGDGKSEILLRNPTSGLLSIVYGAATAQPRIDTLSGPDPQTWRTGTVGDFNGDGCSDIVWRNASTGQINVWSMQGSAMTGSTLVPGIDASWTLIR